MPADAPAIAPDAPHDRYIATLERLLAVQAGTVREALDRASDIIAEILATDKIDAYLYEPAGDALVALGVSDTPMGRREREVGLDRLPLAGGGRHAEVFRTGRTYHTCYLERDHGEVPGFVRDLDAHSAISVPLEVAGERRGVLGAIAVAPEAFSPEDVRFVGAVAGWLGLVVGRVEAEEVGRRAEAAVRLRDDFLRMAAHDLRSPLTSMRGRAQLVQARLARDGAVDGEWLRDQMDAVGAATTSMLAIIDELGDIARLQEGQNLGLEREGVDVGALARAVAEEVGLKRPTPVRVDVPATPIVVEGDRARLERVLHNIIGNAVKYSPPDAPMRVTVAAAGGDAAIAVRDEGVGIPAEDLPHLFTRYYRASTARGTPGSGLGLAGSKAIVEQHGGAIAVESAVGRGTTVTITLPRASRAPTGEP